MVRPFLSLVLAVAATVGGLAATWLGAAEHVVASGRLGGPAGGEGVMLTVVGILLLGASALTIALHWVGAMVVGAVHALLGLLALVVPFGNPFGGGIFSPVFQITAMLATFDRTMGSESQVFYFSGTAFVVGAFLVGAALGVRSRRLSPPARRKAIAISSVLGALLVLGSTAVLLLAGGAFVRALLQMMKYDAVLAGVTVVGGVLAGLAGLFLRWSSLGVALAGALVLAAGAVLFSGMLPPTAPGAFAGAHGTVLLAGVTVLGAALGGMARSDEVPVASDGL